MFNSLFGGLVEVITSVLREVINFVTAPIVNALNDSFPQFSSYLNYFYTFFSDYFFKGAKFIKNVFINLTGCNTVIFELFIGSLIFIVGIHAFIIVLKTVYNVWCLFRGGKTSD